MLGTHGLSLMVYGYEGGSGTSDSVHDNDNHGHGHHERKDSNGTGTNSGSHTMISHHSFAHPVYVSIRGSRLIPLSFYNTLCTAYNRSIGDR
jgi:hypothetical protein